MILFMSEMKEKILKVSAQIIAHEGLRMFTAKRVGEKLEVSDSAIFKHFPSMDSVAEEVVRKYGSEWLRRIEEVLHKGVGALEKIELILEAQADLAEETKGVVPLLFFELLRSGNRKVKRSVFELLRIYLKRVREVAEEGVKKGELRRGIDPEEVGFAIVGFVQGEILKWFVKGRKGKVVKGRKTVKELLLEGLRA